MRIILILYQGMVESIFISQAVYFPLTALFLDLLNTFSKFATSIYIGYGCLYTSSAINHDK